jgi:hypothetical protein
VSPANDALTDDELAVTHEGDHGTRRDLVSHPTPSRTM